GILEREALEQVPERRELRSPRTFRAKRRRGRGTRFMRRRLLIPIVAVLATGAYAHSAFGWTVLVNGTFPGLDAGGVAASDALGNVYVAGNLTTANGSSPAVVKLADTNELWRYSAAGADNWQVVDLALDPSGHPIVAFSAIADATGIDWVVTKLDRDTGVE